MPIRNNTQYGWLVNAIANHTSNDCLLWPFKTNKKGYGRIFFKGQNTLAHRVGFFAAFGHWPYPMACHTCDVKACVNPRHIFEGTNQDNQDDAASKFRCGRKLTPAMVAEIRRDYVPRKAGFNTFSLGAKYGVDHATISEIVSRKYWKFVP